MPEATRCILRVGEVQGQATLTLILARLPKAKGMEAP
jgi:hypothetical protein